MTRTIKLKNITVGGDAPISIQSMTNTDTADISATLAQISKLDAAGCNIVRLAVRDAQDVDAAKTIIQNAPKHLPLVADIQFDYKLAVACADIGFDKIRINPGNVGGENNLKEIAAALKANGTAVRVGVNAGSLEKDLQKSHQNKAEALMFSALNGAEKLEAFGVRNIVLSVKASDVKLCVSAYRLLSDSCEYPLHIGITESGTVRAGTLKSAVGLGALLLDGIGDTMRVSLSGDPVQEVVVAREILRAAGRDKNYVEVISCPTCARCKFNLAALAEAVELRTAHIKKPLKIAVMGCAVNGPGEAAGANFGICGAGDGELALFIEGKIVKKIKSSDALAALTELIEESL